MGAGESILVFPGGVRKSFRRACVGMLDGTIQLR